MNCITDTIMPHKTIIRLSGVAQNPANGFPARLLEPGSSWTDHPVEKQSALVVFTGAKWSMPEGTPASQCGNVWNIPAVYESAGQTRPIFSDELADR